MPHHQLIVVGGGLAGLRAAVEAKADGLDVAIISQVHPGRSHSGAAQGGINAALANHPEGHDDTPEKHAFDTVKGSDYLADQDAVIQMTKDAPGVIFEMDHWGCPFSRFDDGRIAQRPFGGAGYPRTCYGADKTGHYLLHCLVERAYERQVKMYIEVFVTSLIVQDGVCRGVIAYDMISGGFHAFTADAVVMATGGAGRLYSNTHQRHHQHRRRRGDRPTAPACRSRTWSSCRSTPRACCTTNILMSEGPAARAATSSTTTASASWSATRPRPWSSPRATSRRAPSRPRSTRAAASTARATCTWTCGTSAAERIKERLPGIRDLAIHFEGVDPVEEPMPIVPSQHYSMGGIDMRRRRAHADAGPVRRRRVRLRERARRQPARRQLAARDHRLRPPRRRGRGRRPARRRGAAPTRRSPRPRPWPPWRRASPPGRARQGRRGPLRHPREMTTTMKEHYGVFRDERTMREGLERLLKLKERCTPPRPAQRRRHLQPGHDAHPGAGGHARSHAVRGPGRRRAHRVTRRARAHRLSHARRRELAQAHHGQLHPEGPVLTYRPVTLGFFEPQERVY